MKRAFCLLLIFGLLLSVFPAAARAAEGDSEISPAFVHFLQEKFPDGKYWNHAPDQPNNPDGWTDQPCTHHDTDACTAYDGSCGCNMFDDCIQCAGFAAKLASLYTGTMLHTWKRFGTTEGLKAGDVVRINNDQHSIFITAIRGDVITYADCNLDSDCRIRWNARITRERLEEIVTYVKVSPVDTSVPLRPALTCKGYHKGGEAVEISWLPLANADEYQLRITLNGADFRNVTVTEYACYSFLPEQTGCYSFEVTAKNRYGVSEPASCSTLVDLHECRIAYFTDVQNVFDWSHEGIEYVVVNGLFKGTGETTFSPEATMTRAMIATVLWRAENCPAPKIANPYADVAEGTWYTDATCWAFENGIMDGVGNGRFDPDGVLTREQIVTVLFRYAGKPGGADPAALTAYTDERHVADWAKDAACWAVAEQIMQGVTLNGSQYLMPTGGATRAQVATILMRFLSSARG